MTGARYMSGSQEEDITFKEYIDLEEGEFIVEVIKRKASSYFSIKLVRAVYFWVAIIIILSIVNAYVPPVARAIAFTVFWWIIGIWAAYFIIAMVIGFPFVNGHRYIITTTRIIMIRKFVSITFREIAFKRITDLVLNQSPWGRIFNFGSLLPVTAGIEMGPTKMGRFSIEGVENVFKVRKIILERIKAIQDEIFKKYQKKE